MEKRIEKQSLEEKIYSIVRPRYREHLRKLGDYYLLDGTGIMLRHVENPNLSSNSVRIWLKTVNSLVLLEELSTSTDSHLITLLSQLDELLSTVSNSCILIEVEGVKVPAIFLKVLNPFSIDRIFFVREGKYPVIYLLSRGEYYALYLPYISNNSRSS